MYRLATFGTVRLERDRVPVPLGTVQRKRLACLAILAATGPAGTSRESLLALLWPESDGERARNSLKQAVFALRRTLGEGAVVLGPTDVRLDPALVASDVAELRSALARGDDAAAVALYAGPFLDGTHLADTEPFERWVDSERAALAQAVTGALRRLGSAAEREGRTEEAVAWRRRLAALDPLDGAAAAALVTTLAANGEPAAALRQAATHAALVRDALGAAPDPRVREAADRARTLLHTTHATDASVPDVAVHTLSACAPRDSARPTVISQPVVAASAEGTVPDSGESSAATTAVREPHPWTRDPRRLQPDRHAVPTSDRLANAVPRPPATVSHGQYWGWGVGVVAVLEAVMNLGPARRVASRYAGADAGPTGRPEAVPE